MKRELELDANKKAEMIRLFAEALDKNTKDQHQVWEFLNAMRECSDFLCDQRFSLRQDIVTIIRYINDDLKKKSPSNWADQFAQLAESATETCLLANQQQEGLSIMFDMKPEIGSIIDDVYGRD